MSYRYIGNKTRLCPWLIQHVRRLLPSGGSVADLMCGTASVSEALKASNFEVIASDLMTYSVHHARVRLLLEAPPQFSAIGKSYPEILEILNSLPPVEDYYFREYSEAGDPCSLTGPRSYLSAENGRQIDAIILKINEWADHGMISPVEESLLRHDVILATNRIANIAGTYGHYRSSWSNGSTSRINLEPTEFLWGYSCDHRVMQGPVEAVSALVSADLCYLDPPYMKRQYAANYHLLETIARGDFPDPVGKSGLRPWRDQYSNFCSKLNVRDSFQQILKNMDCPVFLISYSEDGLLPPDELTSLFNDYGEVKIHKKIFKRFRSNQSPLSPTLTEYLFEISRH